MGPEAVRGSGGLSDLQHHSVQVLLTFTPALGCLWLPVLVSLLPNLSPSSCSCLRVAYLGLTLSLRTISFIICIPGFVLLSRQLKKEERNGIHGALANGGAELEALRKEDFVISNLDQSQQASDSSTDRETQL